MLKTLFLLSVLFLSHLTYGEYGDGVKRYTRSEYIETWKDEAIKQMREHGIPASITLAQGILESGDGNSDLAREANNHFGIKCHDWAGKKTYKDDDRRNECFRKYGTAHESFEDHSEFLKRSRYAFLFDFDVTDYKSWARGLKKAGYATNPSYPALLIRIIEENHLETLDNQGLSKNYRPQKPKSQTNNVPKSSANEIVIDLKRDHKIFKSDNGINFIIAEKDMSMEKLAQNLAMGSWQLAKYNDLEKDERIAQGDKIYIQPKRNKSKKYASHTVATGETLQSISQMYGVKMQKIRKYSDLSKNYKPKPGDVLRLRK